jgi:fermentation-respiration switch protein FrsA (DUF1100 family)
MTQTTVFRVAAGLIGLHVLDDSFLQPQPGSGPADHLVSGLVPLALLALAAWGYPRMRAGLRGALALVLALPAALSGVEAIHYGPAAGLSGDDYTGILAMAAAPLLIGLGVVTLWRSRRTGDALYRRYPRRALKLAVVVAVAPLIAMPVSIAYVGSHAARSEVPPARLGATYEDVTLRTSDGLELEGWYVPSRNGAAVIAFPGRSGTRKHARMLADNGYGVLLYDRRGEGASQGDPNGWGWDFDKDIEAGIEFLERRPDVEAGRIGGLGLSVGGEMLLQTAAKTTGLAAVVSEGAGARTLGEEVSDAAGLNKVSAFVSYLARDAANAVFSNQLPPEHLEKLIPKIGPRPIMLIHAGSRDVGTLNPDYYRAARGPKQIWEVPEGGHTDGIDVRPNEYERRVVSFFDDALLDD